MEKGPKLSQIQTFLDQKYIVSEQSIDASKCFYENEINGAITLQNSLYQIHSNSDNLLNKEQIYNISNIQAQKGSKIQINTECPNSQFLQLGTGCFVENIQKCQPHSRTLSVESSQVTPSTNSFALNNQQRYIDPLNLKQQFQINEQIQSNKKLQYELNLNQAQIPQQVEGQIHQQIPIQPFKIIQLQSDQNQRQNNIIYLQQNPQYQSNQNQILLNQQYLNNLSQQNDILKQSIQPQMNLNRQSVYQQQQNLDGTNFYNNKEMGYNSIQPLQQQLNLIGNKVHMMNQTNFQNSNNFYSPQILNYQNQYYPCQVQKMDKIYQNQILQIQNTPISDENNYEQIYNNQSKSQNIQAQISSAQKDYQNTLNNRQQSPQKFQIYQNQIKNISNQIQNSPNNQIQGIENKILYPLNSQQNTLNIQQNNNGNDRFQFQINEKDQNNNAAERHCTITFGSSNHLNTVQSNNNNSSTLQLLQPYQASQQNDNSKGSSIIVATAEECKTISEQSHLKDLTADLDTDKNELHQYRQLVASPAQNIQFSEIAQSQSEQIVQQLRLQQNSSFNSNQYFPNTHQRQSSQSLFISNKDNSTALISPLDFYFIQNQKYHLNSQQTGETNQNLMKFCDLSQNSEIKQQNDNQNRSYERKQNKQQQINQNKFKQNKLIKLNENTQTKFLESNLLKKQQINQIKLLDNKNSLLENSQNKLQQSNQNSELNLSKNLFYYKSNPNQNKISSKQLKQKQINKSLEMAVNYYERIRQFNETSSKEEKIEISLSHHKQCFPNSRPNSMSKLEKSIDLSNMVDSICNSTKSSHNKLCNSQNIRAIMTNHVHLNENLQILQDEEQVVRSKSSHSSDMYQQKQINQQGHEEEQDLKLYQNNQQSNEKKLQLLLSPTKKIQNLKQIQKNYDKQPNQEDEFLDECKQSQESTFKSQKLTYPLFLQKENLKNELYSPPDKFSSLLCVAEKYHNTNNFSNSQEQKFNQIENQTKQEKDQVDQSLQQSFSKYCNNNLDISIKETNTKKNRYQSIQLPSQPSDRLNHQDPISSLKLIKPEQYNQLNKYNNIDKLVPNQSDQFSQINDINIQLSTSQQLHKKQPKQVNTVYIDMSQITNLGSENSTSNGQSQASQNTNKQNQQDHYSKQQYMDNIQIEDINNKENIQRNNTSLQNKIYLQNQYNNIQNNQAYLQQSHEQKNQQTLQNGRNRIIQQNIQNNTMSTSKQLVSSSLEENSTNENKIIHFDTQFQTQEDQKSVNNKKNYSTLSGKNMVTLESQPNYENVNIQRFTVTLQTLQTEPNNLCFSNNQTPQKNIDEIGDDNDESKNDSVIEFTPDNSLYYVQESPEIIGKQIRPTIVPALNLQKNVLSTLNTQNQNTSFNISQSPSYYCSQQQIQKNQITQFIPSNKQYIISNSINQDTLSKDPQGLLCQKILSNNQSNGSNNYISVITCNDQKTNNFQSGIYIHHQQQIIDKYQQALQVNAQEIQKIYQTTNQNQNSQNFQNNYLSNTQINNESYILNKQNLSSNKCQLSYLQNQSNQQTSIPDFQRRSSLANLQGYKTNATHLINKNQNKTIVDFSNNKNYYITNQNSQSMSNSTIVQQNNISQKRQTLDQSQIINQSNKSKIVRNKSLGSISCHGEGMGIEMFMTKKSRQELDTHLMQLENRIKHLQKEEESILRKSLSLHNKAEHIKKVQLQAQEDRQNNQTYNYEQKKLLKEQRGRISQEKRDQQFKLKNSIKKNLVEKQEITKTEKFKFNVNKCLVENNKQNYQSRSNDQKNQIKQNQQKFQEQRNLLQQYNQTHQTKQFLLKIKEEKNKKEDIEQKIRDLQVLESQLVQRLKNTYDLNKSNLKNSNIQLQTSMYISEIEQQQAKQEQLLTTTENNNTNVSFTVFAQY